MDAALFRDALVDGLHVTICPFVLGGRTAPTIAEGEGVARLVEAAHLRLVQRRHVDADLLGVFKYVRSRRGSDPSATE